MVRRPPTGSALLQMEHWRGKTRWRLGCQITGRYQEITACPGKLSKGGEVCSGYVCERRCKHVFSYTTAGNDEWTASSIAKSNFCHVRGDGDCIHSLRWLIKFRFLRGKGLLFGWTYFLKDGHLYLQAIRAGADSIISLIIWRQYLQG